MKTTIDIGGQKISIESDDVSATDGAIPSADSGDVLAGDNALAQSVESLVRFNFSLAMARDVSAEASRSSEGVGQAIGRGATKIMRIIINALKSAFTWATSNVTYITQRIQGKSIEKAFAKALGNTTKADFSKAYDAVASQEVETEINAYYAKTGFGAEHKAIEALDKYVAAISVKAKGNDRQHNVELASAALVRELGLSEKVSDGKAAARELVYGTDSPEKGKIKLSEVKDFVLGLVGTGSEAAPNIGKNLTALAKAAKTISIIGSKSKNIATDAQRDFDKIESDPEGRKDEWSEAYHQTVKEIQFAITFENELVSSIFRGLSFAIKAIHTVNASGKTADKTEAKPAKAAPGAIPTTQDEKTA